jgi:aspartate kinase
MIVMKFGGTSTQDAAAMANVAGIVQNHLARKPVVVISAIAQATNELEQIGKLAAEGSENQAHGVLENLFSRHYAIVDELIKDRQRHQELRKTISAYLGELETLIKGVAILRELTPRTLDRFYSFGELLSSLIVSYVFREKGVDAIWLDTKDFMITDDSFNRALPMMEMVSERLASAARPAMEAGKVLVTQGFLGVTQQGERTTMGRESSDYSAAVIGAVLGAEDVQIWTDVDGVLTADPRVVPNPRKVKVLSFDEAYELSYFGAKVLHPNTMLPALERSIPIHVFNSRRPNLSGTLITSASNDSQAMVKSIAFRASITILTVSPLRRLSPYIFWEHIYSVLTKHRLVPRMSATSEYKIAVALDANSNLGSAVRDLAEIGRVEAITGKGIVCVVGQNIRNSPGLVSRIFSILAERAIEMISYGGSASNVGFVVDENLIPEVVRRLHAEFFDAIGDSETFEVLGHLGT